MKKSGGAMVFDWSRILGVCLVLGSHLFGRALERAQCAVNPQSDESFTQELLPNNRGLIVRFPGVSQANLPASEIAGSTAKDRETFLRYKTEDELNDFKSVFNVGNFSGQYVKNDLKNGLLSAIYTAYSHHVPLVLRPDDLWISMLTSFSVYARNHPEEIRPFFVDHQGKQKLSFVWSGGDPSKLSTQESELIIDQLVDLIRASTKNRVVDWLTPQFSTTTKHDARIAGVILFSIVANFYEYVGFPLCGISEVHLEGTLDDWMLLRDKAGRFEQFGGTLARWHQLLDPVLEKLVETREGKIDFNFWQSIVSRKPLGSGNDVENSGWFAVFAPFSPQGQYLLNAPANIAAGDSYFQGPVIQGGASTIIASTVVSVGFALNDNGGKSHNMKFVGGLSSPVYEDTQSVLRPASEWGVFIEK